ncbi:hypothetical protein O59_000678 [Cellvibrio sp. BR]|nr:hypothetical protein O59_000678 [Cellvibrio sp. BR]
MQHFLHNLVIEITSRGIKTIQSSPYPPEYRACDDQITGKKNPDKIGVGLA